MKKLTNLSMSNNLIKSLKNSIQLMIKQRNLKNRGSLIILKIKVIITDWIDANQVR